MEQRELRSLAWLWLCGQMLVDRSTELHAVMAAADLVLEGYDSRFAVSVEALAMPAGQVRDTHPQRERVAKLEAIYREYGEQPPKPALLSKWATKFGVPTVVEVLHELGLKGHLAKPAAYTIGALNGKVQVPVESVVAASSLKDGEELPTGWRWSAALQRAVRLEDWLAEAC